MFGFFILCLTDCLTKKIFLSAVQNLIQITAKRVFCPTEQKTRFRIFFVTKSILLHHICSVPNLNRKNGISRIYSRTRYGIALHTELLF